MKRSRFMTEFFRDNETIDVNCVYLQQQFREQDRAKIDLKTAHTEIELLKSIIKAKDEKIDFLMAQRHRLDEVV